MTNHSQSEDALLNTLINLCDDLAWGRTTNDEPLFNLTKQGLAPEPLTRLAEAFGLMLVKVESRKLQSEQLICDLTSRNAELEAARKLLTERNTQLLSTVRDTYSPTRIVGRCEAMRKAINLALAIAHRPINTLLLGPTGAGKEVFAKLIHFNSPRHEGPFVAVNCTAIPDSLFESEMFGIEKGVATGVNSRRGLVEEANGGTLFLDELADMALPNQAKLLRVLEEREVMRVGSNKPVPVDIKVIAATNVGMEEAIAAKRFREDLYYRINVAEIRIPPLCERGDDILLLAQLFMDRHSAQMGRPHFTISSAVQKILLAYSWPGNVRELNNEMERAAALTQGNQINPEDLSTRILQAVPCKPPVPTGTAKIGIDPGTAVAEKTAASQNGTPPVELPAQSPFFSTSATAEAPFNLLESERELIRRALTHTSGNRSHAASLLGITREGLRKKLLRMDGTEQEPDGSNN